MFYTIIPWIVLIQHKQVLPLSTAVPSCLPPHPTAFACAPAACLASDHVCMSPQ